MRNARAGRMAGLLLIVWLAAACRSRPTPTPTIAPTPTPDAAAILRQAGEAMQGLQSAHFEISRSGGPAYLDADQLLIFSSAAGDYAAPGSIRAEVTVAGPGLAMVISMVAIGEEQWVTNPLNQQWERLPPDWGFNPAILFDEALGWRPMLNEDVGDVRLEGMVTLDGVQVYHVRGAAAGERLRVVTGGIAGGDEPSELEAWVDAATFHVVQLHLVTASPSGEPSDWLLKFSQFNAPVTIEPPV